MMELVWSGLIYLTLALFFAFVLGASAAGY